jgi:hypothetical protein
MATEHREGHATNVHSSPATVNSSSAAARRQQRRGRHVTTANTRVVDGTWHGRKEEMKAQRDDNIRSAETAWHE